MAGLQKILDIHNIKLSEYDVFVETGLYDGENISSLFTKGYFNDIDTAYSIELNASFIEKAYKKFPFLKESNVQLLNADSGSILNTITSSNQEKRILFWLDAHYSGGDTSKSDHYGECPIIAEVESIKNLKKKPTIIIDDLGCFLYNTPFYYNNWPRIEEIIEMANKYFEFEVFISDRDEKNQLHYCILY